MAIISNVVTTMITLDPSQRDRGLRALLVDDNPEFRKTLTRQLEKMGCCVDSSAEAVGFLSNLVTSETTYDFAVVDLHLPDLHGDKIVSWLRESELREVQSLPVLIVTGFPNDLSDTFFVDDVKIALLTKPYRYSELVEAVSRLLVRGEGIN